MKVVIIDDESPIREWLEMCIERAGDKFEVVGSFSNGEDAYRFIKENRPDIVLTDIVMSKMDGLEFLKKARVIYPELKVVLLTSHSDFEFARTAIKNGADDYLLKTELDKEEIAKHLHRLAEDISEVSERKGDGSEAALLSSGQYIRGLWQAYSTGHDVEINKALLEQHGVTLDETAFIVVSINHDVNEVRHSVLFEHKALYNPFMCVDHKGASLYLANIHKDYSNPAILKSIGIRLTEMVAYKSYIGISRVYHKIEQLMEAFQDAYQMREYRFYLPSRQFDYISDKVTDKEIRSQIIEMKKGIVKSFNRYSINDVMVLSEEMMAYIKEQQLSNTVFVKRNLADMVEQIGHVTGDDHKHVLALRNDILEAPTVEILSARVLQYLEGFEEQKRYSSNIENAIQYILLNFRHDVSLADVAGHTGFSEEYMSRLFKKEVGVNYSEFLNKVRMKEAHQLIITTDMKVGEIAAKVGIANSAYFTQLFKKEFGETPSSIRHLS